LQNQIKSLLKKQFALIDESKYFNAIDLSEKQGRVTFNDFLRVMDEQSQSFAEPSSAQIQRISSEFKQPDGTVDYNAILRALRLV